MSWSNGVMPENVVVSENSRIEGEHAFKRFRSRAPVGLRVGKCTTLDDVRFAVGPAGRIEIGDWCYLTAVVLLCDLELKIGNYVRIGWNTTIADTDFHPVDPLRRIEDAIACSPLSPGSRRPEVGCSIVTVEDNVWIGPQATILKGVRIGAGAFIEPGAVVTRDVPAGARVLGNPARVVEQPC